MGVSRSEGVPVGLANLLRCGRHTKASWGVASTMLDHEGKKQERSKRVDTMTEGAQAALLPTAAV
jgi:hypothetical protein